MAEPSHAEIRFAGEAFIPDPSGALFWPRERTLLVADLHFEKATSYGRDGHFLPPYDTRATLDRLEQACARFRPAHVLCLGDSFHDAEAVDRLDEDDRARLSGLVADHDWHWIAGNHDGRAGLERLGGAVDDEIRVGGLALRHELDAANGAAAVICGHFHPKATIGLAHRRITGRCFIFDQRLMIVPAFGAFTGGLNVADPAIGRLFPSGFALRLIARRHIMALDQSHVL